jgi:hypothetical protein
MDMDPEDMDLVGDDIPATPPEVLTVTLAEVKWP